MQRRAFCASAAAALGVAALPVSRGYAAVPVVAEEVEAVTGDGRKVLLPAADVEEAYGGNYERLLELKRKYDPENLFRLNANIDPRA